METLSQTEPRGIGRYVCVTIQYEPPAMIRQDGCHHVNRLDAGENDMPGICRRASSG